jgi:hypothetical protein
VRTKAIKVIDEGHDLDRWRGEPQLLKKRESVLANLRSQLLLPPPPERRILRPFKKVCEWEVGELISYRLGSGRFILFRVIGYHVDQGGTSPVCELLDWVGDTIPAKRALATLPIKKEQAPRKISQVLLGGSMSKGTAGRVARVGTKTAPEQKPSGYTGFTWRYLDGLLAEIFGLD